MLGWTLEEALGLPASDLAITHRRLARLALVADVAAHLLVALAAHAAELGPIEAGAAERAVDAVLGLAGGDSFAAAGDDRCG